jgi:hypothetical protein
MYTAKPLLYTDSLCFNGRAARFGNTAVLIYTALPVITFLLVLQLLVVKHIYTKPAFYRTVLNLNGRAIGFSNVAVLIPTPLVDVYTALPVIRRHILILLLLLSVLSCPTLCILFGSNAYTPGFYIPPIVDRRK